MDNKEPEIIVLDTSGEAAQFKTVEGWVGRDGSFWGADERMARYCGSTHTTCDCGGIVKKGSWCQPCKDKRAAEKFAAMERKPWDGVSMLYAEASEQYFGGIEELMEHSEFSGIPLADLKIFICEPNYASQADGESLFGDDLPEDCELPCDLQAALDIFNEAIKEVGPLSWSPGEFALDLTSVECATA